MPLDSLWPYLDPLGQAIWLRSSISASAGRGGAGVSGDGRRARDSCRRASEGRKDAIAGGLHSGTGGADNFLRRTLSQSKFAGLWAAFGLLWLFAMPFNVRLALQADPNGRVAMLVPALQFLGTAFGPVLSSFLVTKSQPRLVALICAGFALTAASLLLVLRWLRRGSEADVVHDAHPSMAELRP